MNSWIKFIIIVMVLIAGGLFGKTQVFAGCTSSNECPSGWTCIGYIDKDPPDVDVDGSCQQQGCFANISCDPPLECSGDICLPPGSGGGGGGWVYEGALCSDIGWVQSCYNTKGYCTYRQQCVPLTSNKLVASTGCSSEHPSYLKCQVNCGCCPAGSTWQCTTEGKTAYVIPAAEGNTPKMCKADELYDNTSWWTNGAVKCWQEACGCTPLCGATAPSGLDAAVVSQTQAELSWTPGTATVSASQRLYVDADADAVAANCVGGPDPACLVEAIDLPLSQSDYQVSGLIPNTTYYYKVVTYESDTCQPAATAFLEIEAVRPAWFQVEDGNIHADSGSITSAVPDTCSGACEPALITQSSAGATGLVSLTGNLSLGSGTINADGNPWTAATIYRGAITDYTYFERILADDPAGINSWSGGLPSESGVYRAEQSIDTTGGNWNIPANRKIVLLADGNVTVNQNISVATGGFLAIIASGDITFDSAVTNVQGVFLSNGEIITETGSNQLIGEGIFVGWSGFSLNRDLGAGNNTAPAERFVYRPDLQYNAYRYLLWLDLAWQEAAP